MDLHLYIKLLVTIPVNHPRRVAWQDILASFQPAMLQPDLNFQWRIEDQRILIKFSPWGDIGYLTIKELTLTQVEIQFYLSPLQSKPETEQVESAIRTEILNNRPTHGDLLNNPELTLQNLADALYSHKRTLLIKIRDWLAFTLGIWGLIEQRTPPANFSFVIDGTPAQFAVMLRHFFPSFRPINDMDDVTVVVMKSDIRELIEIPPDINPILVNIFSAKSQLNIVIHSMPNMHSLLRVNLIGDANSWRLWDVIRDEMARVDWFHLPQVPKQLVEETDENRVPEVKKPDADIQQPWLVIPDEGNNRLIVQLWNENKSYKEIGLKVGSAAKTVMNRIIQLRKKFGPHIVPYRKGSQEKDRKSDK